MKQVIVVNQSLKLPKGKLAAQVAHAAVAAFLRATTGEKKAWLEQGMPKVVLKCFGEEELFALQDKAFDVDVPNCIIRDAGKTVVPEGTVTCLGLGPSDSDIIDILTSDLKLL
jgi:PTH2 family peptidyl-tRNA hydrolase